MATIIETATSFFDAAESGKGWEAASQYCHPDAAFSAQSDALADVTTIEAYCGWMAGILAIMPDASYEIKSAATDVERNNVVVAAVFHGTHTGEGGPLPPTGKSTSTEYAFVVDFDGDKVSHVTKIWNSQYAIEELGWT